MGESVCLAVQTVVAVWGKRILCPVGLLRSKKGGEVDSGSRFEQSGSRVTLPDIKSVEIVLLQEFPNRIRLL